MNYEAYHNGKLTYYKKPYSFSLENADLNHQIILQTLDQIQKANIEAGSLIGAQNRK